MIFISQNKLLEVSVNRKKATNKLFEEKEFKSVKQRKNWWLILIKISHQLDFF